MIPPTALIAGAAGPGNSRHDFLVINDWARHTVWLHGFMKLYASDGIVLLALMLPAGWWIARRAGGAPRMALALWAAIGTVVAVAVNRPIVDTVREKRPYATLHHTVLLVHRSTDFSFPSDHTTMAGAVAAGALLVSWRLGLAASAAALLMAFARVYVGAHWPRDVFAGLIFGATVVLMGYLMVVPALTRLVDRLQRTRIRPVLTATPSRHSDDGEPSAAAA